ncbi:MAG: hypothetical protein A2X49_09965 [Lentisphaerae bacterium GWF2_52_8]|nr:MAG: hypothetical protein A2X49_09965 [Lentisphaerae bacterium GWF2_52_8]
MNLNQHFKDASTEFSSAFNEASERIAQPEASFFFDREFVLKAAGEAKLPGEATDLLLRFLEKLSGEKELCRTISALHELCFGTKPMSPGTWPEFSGTLLENEAAVNLLLVLSGFPNVHRKYDARKIPQEVLDDTLADIPLWLKRLKMDDGTIGLSRRILSWLFGHFSADLYRLGRLQFCPLGKFNYAFRIYRNKKNKRVLALAEDGTSVDAAGFLTQKDEEPAWKASLSITEKEIRGFPTDPQGLISREPICLDASEWTEAIAKGAAVLDVHIPEGEALSVEACRDSFEKALRFFLEHYPELDFKAFTCTSWLFDPVFLKILKPSSNILSFYKEFYCVPYHHGICTNETLRRVFGKDRERLDEAPKDTSMKKAIFEHYKNGGVFRESGAFILMDEISTYGQENYWNDFQKAREP